jgi:malate synthase
MTGRTPVTVDRSALPAEAVDRVLTPEALDFVAHLEREFGRRRRELLAARADRQAKVARGAKPGFLADTEEVRRGDWRVAPAPADLDDRRVEITGPVERKMMINALNSGASVFMADLEDSLSPTGTNVIEGQVNLMDAVRRSMTFTNPDGKQYALGDTLATLVVRPRGWHLPEKHLTMDGNPLSASLVDFGLYFFHNAAEAVRRGTGPYFYLAKLEGHREARLWNDVFVWAQQQLGIPHGTIRATVLIETIFAAFEMEEILHELRDHAAGLNAGRWDYIFSVIKKFRHDPAFLLPDRAQVTMTVPFMAAYSQLLAQTCHRRGAHAIGGMAAFIPNRRDEEVTERALAKVTEDKEREARQGFDGTWVAHPDLVPVAGAVFDRVLGTRPNQKDVIRSDVTVQEGDLLDVSVPGGQVTMAGVQTNVRVALQYLEGWLRGTGAVAINNLMEDAATAEISRAQLWQWRRHGARLGDGTRMTSAVYQSVRDAELASLTASADPDHRYAEAVELLDGLVEAEEFTEFLTLPGYEYLA